LWCSKGKGFKKYTFNHKLMKKYNGNKQMTSVWQIGLCIGEERLKGADGKKAHSTQKPEENKEILCLIRFLEQVLLALSQKN